jgi:hypothetical protein
VNYDDTLDKYEALWRKAVLCNIIYKVDNSESEEGGDGSGKPVYSLTPRFINFLTISAGILNQNPDMVKICKGLYRTLLLFVL